MPLGRWRFITSEAMPCARERRFFSEKRGQNECVPDGLACGNREAEL